jgi:hypothetical protein
MAIVDKILIRLTKSNLKISKVVDATNSFNVNESYYQDLSGWDDVVVEVVNPTSSIGFNTTNDNGYVNGILMPAPQIPTNWVEVIGIDLLDNSDVSIVDTTSNVLFGAIGQFLQIYKSDDETFFILTEDGDPIITENDLNLITE